MQHNRGVDTSMCYPKWQIVELLMLCSVLFWTNFEYKCIIEFQLFHTRIDNEDSPQFSLPLT